MKKSGLINDIMHVSLMTLIFHVIHYFLTLHTPALALFMRNVFFGIAFASFVLLRRYWTEYWQAVDGMCLKCFVEHSKTWKE